MSESLPDWLNARCDARRTLLALAGLLQAMLSQAVADEPAAKPQAGVQVEGLVTDAEQVKAPEFEVYIGKPATPDHELLWKRAVEAVGRNGRFRLFMPDHAVPFVLRIEAPGCRSWISETITGEQPERRLFVQLESGPVLTGRVLTPDGEPASGAVVTLVTDSHSFQLTAGYQHLGGRRTVTTGKDGVFRFIPPDETYLLVVTHETGYAELSRDEQVHTVDVALEAWAQLDVLVVEGVRRRPNVEVAIQPEPLADQTLQVFSYGISGITDVRGRVFFEKLPPRKLLASQAERSEDGLSRWMMRSVEAELRPGESKSIMLGGSGAEIVGRLKLTGKPLFPHQWETNDFLSLREQLSSRKPVKPFAQQARIAADGSFQLPDVPAGQYTLIVRITCSEPGRRSDRGGVLFYPLEVPADTSRLDLGEVAVAWDKVLGPGDPAPRFVVADHEGQAIRDRDFRGRFLLLGFHNVADRQGEQAVAGLAAALQDVVNDPHAAALQLIIGPTVESVERVVPTAGPIGQWAYSGRFPGTQVSNRFDVRRWPDYVLIDPAGTVVARDSNLEEVLQTLREARATWDFSCRPPDGAPITSLPSRETFESAAPIALAACLDNSNYRGPGQKNYEGPGLILWGADGREIRRMEGLGTSGWFTGPERMAIDPQRERLYLCDTANARVVALDLSGRRLSETPLPELHSVTVDPQTGELWCTSLSSLNSGETVILDAQGNERTTLPLHGFRIDYVPTRDLFWVCGESIREVDRNGRLQRELPLPRELLVLTEIIPDSSGGAWVLGDAREDLQGRSLWRLQPEGTFRKLWQFPPTTVARGLERVGEELWCAAITDYQRGAEGPYAREIQRFDLDGQPLAPLAVPASRLFVSDDGARIWVDLERELVQIDRQGNTLHKLDLPEQPVVQAVVR